MRADGPIVSFLVLAACGDPLVGGDYRGEVLASLDGTVRMDPSSGYDLQIYPTSELRVALFYATHDGGSAFEQPVVVETEFPARYRVDVHHPPPAEAIFEAAWSETEVAVATPLLYADLDADGRWQKDVDPIVGGSPDLALVWSSGTVTNPITTTADWFIELRPGFQRMFADRPICIGQDQATTWFPAEDYPVDLWVGPAWDWLIDWNCNGHNEEWGQICPPLEEVEAMVEADAAVLSDPYFGYCYDQDLDENGVADRLEVKDNPPAANYPG
jgi:hypothetical protein